MIKDLGVYVLDKENVKKYKYNGKPYLNTSNGDYVRKSIGFFPAPEKFEGLDNQILMDKMKSESFKNGVSDNFLNFKLKSTDGNILDSIEIIPKKIQPNPVYVLNIFGACDSYEQYMESMRTQSERTNAINVGFNIPGIGKSTGVLDSKHAAIKAGVSQILRLLENGVAPEKIIVSGHSIGAGIAVECAEHMHKHGIKVNLFHNRSFGNNSLAGALFKLDVREDHVAQKKNFGRILPTTVALEKLLYSIGTVASWEMSSNKAYNDIPETFKDYIVIKPDKIDRKIMTGDEMVREKASLHYMQKNKRHFVKEDIKLAVVMAGSIKHINDLSDTLERIDSRFTGSFESREQLNKICAKVNLIKNEVGRNHESENFKNLPLSEVQYDLRDLYKLYKYERKFVVNTQRLIKDTQNPRIMRQRYNERCDRFLLKRDGNIEKNLAEIGKYEPYFAQWLGVGLIKERTKSEEHKIIVIEELAKKMDVHAIHPEYIIQRNEKPGFKQNGLQFFDNLVRSKSKPNKNLTHTL